ncbi:MAG: M20 metallopeptidase family protein, partial [Peptostreptococcaceae bacterium]
DAIVVAAHVITMLQSITSRNISPTNSIVLSLGIINGGVKENVICDEVEIRGTLRTLDSYTRDFAKNRIIDIVENTCSGLLANGIVEIEEGYAPLINDNEVVEYVYSNIENLLGKDKVLLKKHPSLGAEDFSFFLENCKGAFYHLGCRNIEKNITSLLHTKSFNIDEDCLPIGVAAHVLNVLNINKIGR